MDYDVVIVGAGPSGLGAAIRMKQLAVAAGREVSVCVLEKGSEVGAHILSGAVVEPRALDELLPDWKANGAPLDTPVVEDRFLFLTKKRAIRLPTPPQMHNEGNYIVSLGNLCRWLAQQAEGLGVEIFAGFAAAEVLYGEDGAVSGVRHRRHGHRQGRRQDRELHARRGDPRPRHDLRRRRARLADKVAVREVRPARRAEPQTFGLGIKELWEIDPAKHHAGRVVHTVGWPLDWETYGGSFLYHLADNQVAVGYVVGLDYKNPYLSPFEEFQRFKTHPAIRPTFEGGRRIGLWGARHQRRRAAGRSRSSCSRAAPSSAARPAS